MLDLQKIVQQVLKGDELSYEVGVELTHNIPIKKHCMMLQIKFV